jgi:hypothetical protein
MNSEAYARLHVCFHIVRDLGACLVALGAEAAKLALAGEHVKVSEK